MIKSKSTIMKLWLFLLIHIYDVTKASHVKCVTLNFNIERTSWHPMDF